MSDTNWEVHVSGPDDVLPATSRLDAMVQAQQINAATLALIGLNNDDPLYPTVWATPRAVPALAKVRARIDNQGKS